MPLKIALISQPVTDGRPVVYFGGRPSTELVVAHRIIGGRTLGQPLGDGSLSVIAPAGAPALPSVHS
jgi:hypothetical protein